MAKDANEEKGKKKGAPNPYFRSRMMRDGPTEIGSVDWPQAKEGALEGKKLFVTGELETIQRNDLKKLITDCGGTFMSTVSKQLTYLIVGRDCGPVKLQKGMYIDRQIFKTT